MGYLTWQSMTGKIWTILLFVIILIIMFLIITAVVPEMQLIAGVFEEM